MRFTFRQLEYFIAAGEIGSIALASERLNISSSSISTAISHLERELGVQLFVRHHAQGLSLTPAGRSMLSKARQVIEQAEALRLVASDVAGQACGRLAIGYLDLLAPMIMPELSRLFAKAFPHAQVIQGESGHERLMEGLRRGKLDIAITYDLQLPEGVIFTPLASLPVHAILGETHPFADRSAVKLSDLARQPLVLLDVPASREYLLGLFKAEGLDPVVGMRSPCIDVVRSMVAGGQGYSLANERPKNDLTMDGRPLIRVDLTGDHRPLHIGTARLGGLGKSPLIQAFEESCRGAISDDCIPGMALPEATSSDEIADMRLSERHATVLWAPPSESVMFHAAKARRPVAALR